MAVRVVRSPTANYLEDTFDQIKTHMGGVVSAHCWWKPADLSISTLLGCAASTSATVLSLYYRASGDTMQIWSNGSGAACVSASDPFTVNQWNTCGARRDGAINNWNLDLFLNGAKNGTAVGSTKNPDPGAMKFGIGTFGAYTGANGNGELADVAVWDVALTDAEMLALNNGAHPYQIRPQSLKVLFECESATDSLIDRVNGYRLDATVPAPTTTESPLIARPGPIFVPASVAPPAPVGNPIVMII